MSRKWKIALEALCAAELLAALAFTPTHKAARLLPAWLAAWAAVEAADWILRAVRSTRETHSA